MFDGSIKAVEDIVVGDRLMGDNSDAREVLQLHRGRSPMVRITPAAGEPWVCTSNHMMTLVCAEDRLNGDGKTISSTYTKGRVIDIALDVFRAKSEKFKGYWRLFSRGVKFRKKPVPYDPFIYGMWLGDGSVDHPLLNNADPILIETWCSYFKSLGFRIAINKKPDKICGGYFARWMPSQGGGQPNPFTDFIRTSYINKEKRIRRDYLLNDRETRIGVLAGLLDTDGSADDIAFGITTKYIGLRDDIVYLARSLGFKTHARTVVKGIKSLGFKGTYYNVHISGPGVSEIPTLLKKVKRVARQRTIGTGFKIEDIGEDDYYGFELDGNRRFLLGDFTVTHNTYTATVKFLLRWSEDPQHTSIKLVSTSGGHAKSNIFAGFVKLHNEAVIPLPGFIRESYIGIDINEVQWSIQKVSIGKGEDGTAALRGFHRLPRKTPHPKFGDMSVVFVIVDEADNVPWGFWKGADNIASGAGGKGTIKIYAATNPMLIESEFSSRAQPLNGGRGSIDKDKTFEWEGQQGWHVIRLDVRQSENYKEKREIYQGMMTYESARDYLSKGLDHPDVWCVDETTEALSENGWVNYKDLRIGDRILTLNPDTGKSEMCSVEEVFSQAFDGDLVSIEGRSMSALVTPNHRWLITDNKPSSHDLRFRETKDLHFHDAIQISGGLISEECSQRDIDLALLVGWVVSDGTFRPTGDGNRVTIIQSSIANPHKCQQIRELLGRLGVFSESTRPNGVTEFKISKEQAVHVRTVVPNKKLTMRYLATLRLDELKALLDGLIAGDGGVQGGGTRNVCTIDPEQAGIYAALMGMCGNVAHVFSRYIEAGTKPLANGWIPKAKTMYYVNERKRRTVSVKCLKFKNQKYTGVVWCPRTQNGTFFAKRNGFTYFTGNTFIYGLYPQASAKYYVVPAFILEDIRGTYNFIKTPVNLAAFDPAFEQGGDRAVLTAARYGLANGWRAPNGKLQAITPPRNVLALEQQLEIEKTANPLDMADNLIEVLKRLRVQPEWFVHDMTGNATLLYAYLLRKYGAVMGLKWGSNATESRVFAEDRETAEEQFVGLISEMWFSFSRWAQFNYLKIAPMMQTQTLFNEMSSRKYEQASKTLLKVESKDEFKMNNSGKSPDFSDSMIMAVHLCRIRGLDRAALIPGEGERQLPSDFYKGEDWSSFDRERMGSGLSSSNAIPFLNTHDE